MDCWLEGYIVWRRQKWVRLYVSGSEISDDLELYPVKETAPYETGDVFQSLTEEDATSSELKLFPKRSSNVLQSTTRLAAAFGGHDPTFMKVMNKLDTLPVIRNTPSLMEQISKVRLLHVLLFFRTFQL